MRGKRAPRGIAHRNKDDISGINYTGDAAGVVNPWGGGAAGANTPTVGLGPTITIPIDEDDDGTDKIVSKRGNGGRRTAANSTKSRLRTQLKALANFIAFGMEIFAGTRTAKGLSLDGTGGTGGVVTPPGGINATGGGVFGGALETPSVVYDPPITKKIWCHTSWVNIGATTPWQYNGSDDSWTSQSGSGSIAIAIPLPSGPGTYVLTSLQLRMKKAGTTATGFVVGHSTGLSSTAGNPSTTADATIPDSTSGNRILTASGLALTMTDDIAVYCSVNNADNGDKVFGVFAEFTATDGG